MFRKATPEDIDAIAAIYEETHTAEESGKTTSGWQRGVYPTKNTAISAIKAGEMYVIEVDGQIASAAKINQSQEDVYRNVPWEHPAADHEVMVIHTLVTASAFKGQGYAKMMIKAYEEFAYENGCRFLRMDTGSTNSITRSLYHRLGYKEIGIIPTNFNGIPGIELVMLEKKLDAIYLAGGCFWGMEKLFSGIPCITSVTSGYANGDGSIDPTYELVCSGNTGYKETIRIVYGADCTPIEYLLLIFFNVIDPTVISRQSADVGSQYQTGIYYPDASQLDLINQIADEVKNLVPRFAVEIKPFKNFVKAEEYHQQYLDKNPIGYCHIPKSSIDELPQLDIAELRNRLPSALEKYLH